MKGGPGKNKYGDPKDGVQHLGKGGKVKKRKGYKYGGTVDTPEVSVMPDQPITVPRLTKDGLRDIGQPVGYSHGGPVQKAQRKEPGGRLTAGDVRRAGLK